MRDLPTGTVSMLFSDIERSTLLLTRLGRDYTEALDRHRGLLRSAWAAGAGTEMSTEGDSFFVVFPTAGGAVRAAVLAQRGLEAEAWPGGEHLRVRIGIHTGTPQLHDSDYVGMDVHRAARVAAAAHGGQIVLTSATAELAGGLLPEGVRLKDLGTHHFKDLPEPERVFQLAIDGLKEDFPALRSLGASSNLPIPTTPLVGREPAVSELSRLIDPREVRLVTLTGPGGSGKTRLAIEVAARIAATFPDGVFFVPLAAVADAEVMWTSIADVLALPRGARSPQRLLEQVAQRAALFVFDNLEQLHGADDVVTQLLEAAPRATIITTSRRALGVPGEHLYPVPPLPLPVRPTLSSAKESPAVRLFVQQARRVRPDFRLTADNVTQVVAICRQLDGLPLAIELSAARIRLLSPRALLRRIDQSLDVATRSRQAPSRQRTLRETIAWSYHLLSAQHQAFFRRLGVFAGGADLDAVAAVSEGVSLGSPPADPLDHLAELVDASLVVMSDGPDGEPRITLLETIRSFARDQLRDAGELDVVHSAHAQYYLQVAERLQGLRAVDHLLALHQAETELDNFREALAWALRSRGGPGRDGDADAATDLRLSSSLGWLWYTGGYVLEGSRWLEQALDRPERAPSGQLAEGLALYANLLITQGALERAGELALQSLTMARVVGDDPREAYAMVVLGTAQLHQGDVHTARQTFEDALVLNRRIGDPDRVHRALGNLAGVEEELGNFAHAEELTQEALGIVRQAGDAHEVAVQSQNLAHLLTVSGRAEEAAEIARSLIDSVLQLRSPNLTMAFANTYMNILLRLGDPIRAAQLLGSEQAMRVRLSLPNPHEDEELAEAWITAKDVISRRDWELEIQRGRETELEALLASLSDR